MRRQLSLITILLLFTISSVFAQDTATIKGVIHDSGTPLPGATIFINGTEKGTTSDFDGNFEISGIQPNDYEILITFIGFNEKFFQVQLKASQILDLGIISLEASTESLDEVVITALGIKKEEKSLGYSVTNIKGKEFNEAKETNIVNSLNGKIAGVQITNGSTGIGSTSRIIIRGEASLTSGNNQPLFVVDGIPIDNNTTLNSGENTGGSSGIQEIDYGNGAADINPDDIESISVLKGANAAALYGSRGANGVILITTKSGGENGKKVSVSLNIGTTFESVLRLPKYQNKYGQGWAGDFEYVDGLNNSLGSNDQEDVSWGPVANGQLITQFDSPAANGLRAGDIFARGWVRNADGSISDPSVVPNDLTATPFIAHNNNVKDFFELGYTSTINTSVGINNENSNFLFSAGLMKNKGIIPNTDLKRNSFRLNGNVDITEKLKLSAGINYINSSSGNRSSSGYGSENAMYMFTWYGRTVNTESLKEYWQRGYEGLEQFNYNYAWHDNPYFMLNENTNAFDKNRVLGNIKLAYSITDNLKLKVKSGVDYYIDDRQSKRAFSTQRFLQGGYREDQVKFKEINTDVLLSYNKEIEKWNVGVNLGGNKMHQERSFLSNSSNRLVLPNIYNLGNSALPLITQQNRNKKAINSIYGTFSVGYDNKIFLDVTGRNDWSSTLPKDNNSYFYPSVSLSAIVSDIVELPEAISFFKLRGSYAQVGNDTSPYNLQTTYQYQTPYFGDKTLSRSNTLLNENLKPEMITSFEVGTDIRLFKGLANLDFTYYKSVSEDQIMVVPVSNAVGYTGQVINAGKISNKGYEALLTLKPIRKDNFSWTSSFNFSKNIGEVVELPEGIDVLTTSYASVYDAEGSKVFIQAREGERLGNMYGRKFKRHNGKIIYENGIPVIDDELQLLGNYNPDFSLGFQNSFKYKNIDFSFLFDWKQGGTIISRTQQIASYAGNLAGTEERNDYGDIVPDGVKLVGGEYVPLTQTDAIGWWSYYKPMYNRRDQQETGIVDATYVKLREVKIGYNFPKKVANQIGMESFRIAFVGRNLGLWTPNSNQHFDPETLSLQGANIVPGIEDVSYPSSKSYGVNFLFKF
jgi:TonB-linked SusC/RagA family outer membrane protein